MVVLILQFSCQEIDYDLNEPNTIFVSSHFQNDKIPYFSIFHTISPSENAYPLPVTKAELTVFENEKLIRGFEQIHDGVYENINFMPLPDTDYKVVVDVPGYEQFTCKFKMPKQVSIEVLNHWVDSVVINNYDAYNDTIPITDTTYYIIENEASIDTITYNRIQFKVNDPVNEDNYYGFLIQRCSMFFSESKEPDFEGTAMLAEHFYYAPHFNDKHYANEQQIISMNYLSPSDTSCIELFAMDKRQYEEVQRRNQYYFSVIPDNEKIKPVVDIFNVAQMPDEELVIFDNIGQGGIAGISYMSYYYDTIIAIKPPQEDWVIRKVGEMK